MAESWTTRLGLRRWGVGTDTPARDEFDTSFGNLEDKAAGFLKGTAGARPAAAPAYDRFFYLATDTLQMTYCDGTTWLPLAGEGGSLARNFLTMGA